MQRVDQLRPIRKPRSQAGILIREHPRSDDFPNGTRQTGARRVELAPQRAARSLVVEVRYALSTEELHNRAGALRDGFREAAPISAAHARGTEHRMRGVGVVTFRPGCSIRRMVVA